MEVQHTVPPVSGISVNAEVAFDQLGEIIAGALAGMLDTAFGRRISLPLCQPMFSAYREYVTGQNLFWLRRFDEAIEHLTMTNELDTTFVEVLIQAAVSHRNSGRYAEADSLADIVERFGDPASTFDRQRLAWLRASQQGNRLEALRMTLELAQQDEGRLHRFADELQRVNRRQEAVEVLERLDPRGYLKNWTAYWGVLIGARHILGDHDRELRDAWRMPEQFPDTRGPIRNEVAARAALGRID